MRFSSVAIPLFLPPYSSYLLGFILNITKLLISEKLSIKCWDSDLTLSTKPPYMLELHHYYNQLVNRSHKY